MKFISPIISEASGTVGGAVYAKNRGGNYIRARVVPVQPRTPAQVAVRAAFTSASKAWGTLTDVARAGYTSLASSITLRDSIGNAFKPTGDQLFVSLSQTLTALGKPTVIVPPSGVDAVIALGTLTVVASVAGGTGGTNQLTVLVQTNTATQNILVRASGQVSAGRSFFGRSQYRQVSALLHPSAAAKDITAAYVAKFGALHLGQKLSLSLVPCSDNGFQGSESKANVIVTA